MKGKASSGFLEFGTLRTCEDIWKGDLSNQTVQVLMMHCQESTQRNEKSNKADLFFYAVTRESAWARFALSDEVAVRFLLFKESHLKDKDFAYLQFSSVAHARSKYAGDGDPSMQFRVHTLSLFEEFEPDDVWENVAPTIVDNFAELSGVAAGTRLFVHGRVHELDEVIANGNCNPRRAGAFMDRHGNKRQFTLWSPVPSMLRWELDMVLTVLGARCERKSGFSPQFQLNGDVCIMHHEDANLAEYATAVLTRNWDLAPTPFRP